LHCRPIWSPISTSSIRFIAREIKPLEQADDNIRFFDHRREWARTDFENGGLPRHEWEALLRKVKNLADAPAICALRSRSAMAARTAPISGWP
jgi:hypothetical protein